MRWATLGELRVMDIEVYATDDPNVFCTGWQKIPGKPHKVLSGGKIRTYLAVDADNRATNNAYQVEVMRGMAVDATEKCKEAVGKVRIAIDEYEKNGVWPKEPQKTEE